MPSSAADRAVILAALDLRQHHGEVSREHHHLPAAARMDQLIAAGHGAEDASVIGIVEGQYLSQPQQLRSGCRGWIGNFLAMRGARRSKFCWHTDSMDLS